MNTITNSRIGKQNKVRLGVFLSLFFGASLQTIAAPSLSLVAPHALQGSAINASIQLSIDTATAGVNAHVILPADVTVTSVLPGDLLASAGTFTLQHNVSGQDLTLLAYSSDTTVTGTGELVKLTLQVSGSAPLGVRELAFSTVNANPFCA